MLMLSSTELRAFRWKRVSLVPQGAMNALNPVLRVEKQIADAMEAHIGRQPKAVTVKRIHELLDLVGLEPAVGKRYPHELSGGMKQRVCIAMAVALDPPLLIADEPTSALDVVVQRRVADSLLHIKETLGTSIILIGHDMGLMAQMVDRIAVMYAGRIVEIAPTKTIFREPLHPYTRELIRSVPSIGKRMPRAKERPGPPDRSVSGHGCPFARRCPEAFETCHQDNPDFLEKTAGHSVACHLHSNC
jgi:peptide/nickel transport system ATP-binding protein